MPITKPTDDPQWCTTGSRVDQGGAKSKNGWVAPELPPDTYFNFIQGAQGDYVAWLEERVDDGAGSDDVEFHAPDDGTGDTMLRGAESGGSAGLVEVHGGDATSDSGGSATLRAGNSSSGNFAAFALVHGGNTVDTTGGVASLVGGEPTGVATGGQARVKGGDAVDGIGGHAVITGGAAGGDNTGGQAQLTGGDASGTGNGGNVVITGGDATGATGVPGNVDIFGGTQDAANATGGNISINGSDTATTGGEGGDITITAGLTDVNTGGRAFLRGGDAFSTSGVPGRVEIQGGAPAAGATDTAGERVLIQGGDATGDSGSRVSIDATLYGQGSGTTVRTPAIFYGAEGGTGRNTMYRQLEINNLDGRAGLIQGVSGTPTVEKNGFWGRSTDGAWMGCDSLTFQTHVRAKKTIATEQTITGTTSPSTFSQTTTVCPANFFTVGDELEINFCGVVDDGQSGTTLQIGIDVDGTPVVIANTTVANGSVWYGRIRGVIAATGASGIFRGYAKFGIYTSAGTLNEENVFYYNNTAFDTTGTPSISGYVDPGSTLQSFRNTYWSVRYG